MRYTEYIYIHRIPHLIFGSIFGVPGIKKKTISTTKLSLLPNLIPPRLTPCLCLCLLVPVPAANQAANIVRVWDPKPKKYSFALEWQWPACMLSSCNLYKRGVAR